ncbi:MFS transporter [Actinoplanes sp. HUAS TT8]|uniref:MFS transporter n=1 Tax=Actinoplanes sp. HUAS TT8 TaxID=3447453 RepID=UPI003F51F5E0
MTAPSAGPRPMTRGLTFLFAVAAGAAVGNLYWAQPLLDIIGDDLHTPHGSMGWLITATQLGYAAGILLIVPLGDRLDRRRLIPVMLLCAAAALVLCALAPNFGFLLAAITLLGVTTVSGQILTPLAGDLAEPAHRGRTVGTVASGILVGILTSRTIAGLVAGVAGWRAIYLAAAVVTVLVAALLHRAVPRLAPKTGIAYPALIASVAAMTKIASVRWTLALAATGFAAFTMFWTALTFLLSAPPFDYPTPVIGLFGLAGLAGATVAQRAGRLHDRGLSLPATGLGWALILIAFVIAGLGRHSVVLIVVAILLLDAAIQGVNILNQTRLFALSHEARSRLNTVYITGNFLGGAAGSAGATLLWNAGGWPAITIAGMALSVLALTIWTFGRRGALAPSTPAGVR